MREKFSDMQDKFHDWESFAESLSKDLREKFEISPETYQELRMHVRNEISLLWSNIFKKYLRSDGYVKAIIEHQAKAYDFDKRFDETIHAITRLHIDYTIGDTVDGEIRSRIEERFSQVDDLIDQALKGVLENVGEALKDIPKTRNRDLFDEGG